MTVIGIPALGAACPALLHPGRAILFATAALAPFVYAVLFVLVAGLISLPFQPAIVPGKFPRDLGHPVYARRRLYGLCWTLVYYCKPVYAVCLAIPCLKTMLFRLFGYRGAMEFTVYPDTWIRDLPLLDFGKGVYVANRATLGTNIALSDGSILVDRITLGDRALVGHLTMLAPGVKLGPDAEIGVGCAIGIRCVVEAGALVQPTCTLNHHSRVGTGAVVSTMSYVGAAARIGSGIVLAPGTLLRNRGRVNSPEAAADVLSSSVLVSDLRTAIQMEADELLVAV